MLNLQDLPDELILKIFGYSETKDLITYGQVSKRMRRISHDGTLWVTVNLVKKIVKADLLQVILGKGCKILNISNSTIVGHFSSIIKSPIFKSQLKELDVSQSAMTGSLPVEAYSTENIDVLEELLFSCCSLQCLKMEGLLITPKMAVSICKNGKTLQVLNLNNSHVIEFQAGLLKSSKLQAIITSCQELKEFAFNNGNKWLRDINLEFLARNISPNIVKLNLSNHDVDNDSVKILLGRCNEIKVLGLKETIITNDSLKIETIGTVHIRRRHALGGEESKIYQICRR